VTSSLNVNICTAELLTFGNKRREKKMAWYKRDKEAVVQL
jgi:hypothetical protein